MNVLKYIFRWLKGIIEFFRGSIAPSGPDPIRHVVVLMFENHSFDQMLGCFKATFPEMEGVDLGNLRSNKDLAGREYFQRQHADTVVDPDPKHEVVHILNSLKDGNGGFVSEYEKENRDNNTPITPEQLQRIMDYFGPDDLPALHALARHFTICDHWFSSVPGPTWTNRFFAYSGTSKGIIDMPEHVGDTALYLHYDQDTIFDRLTEKRIPWRVYFGDVPNSLVLLHQQEPENVRNYRFMHHFVPDVQGPESAFPSFCLIEPNYLRGEQNDDHPPHSTMRAQRLLATVYNALRKNENLWQSTLLVVIYDENGGFYDHVPPPTAVPPDQFQEKFAFDRLGVRVPALLVSPWVDRQVLSNVFDHTSLLKYLTEKWSLGPLTQRVKQAKSFSDAFRKTVRSDAPDSIPIPTFTMQAGPPGFAAEELGGHLNENQKALLAFSKHLEQRTAIPQAPPGTVVMESAPEVVGSLAESERAKLRVEAFIDQQSAKTGGR